MLGTLYTRSLANRYLDVRHIDFFVEPTLDFLSRSRLVEQLQGFFQIGPRLGYARALTRDVKLGTKGKVAIAFTLDNRSQLFDHRDLGYASPVIWKMSVVFSGLFHRNPLTQSNKSRPAGSCRLKGDDSVGVAGGEGVHVGEDAVAGAVPAELGFALPADVNRDSSGPTSVASLMDIHLGFIGCPIGTRVKGHSGIALYLDRA